VRLSGRLLIDGRFGRLNEALASSIVGVDRLALELIDHDHDRDIFGENYTTSAQ